MLPMNRILNPVGWEKFPLGTKPDDDTIIVKKDNPNDTIVVKTNADTIVVKANTQNGQKCSACPKPALPGRSRCGPCSRK